VDTPGGTVGVRLFIGARQQHTNSGRCPYFSNAAGDIFLKSKRPELERSQAHAALRGSCGSACPWSAC